MVIPGIGGSALRRPDGTVAWDGSYLGMAGLLANPKQLCDIDDGLRPAGAICTPTRFFGWAPFHGYEVLIDRLAEKFATLPDYGKQTDKVHPTARVVCFPYDFRLDCEHNAAELEDFVGRRLRSLKLGNQRSVIIVAHSMGGIVARTWVDRFDRWSTCRHLVTLGTPHHGAPKALDLLVNGYPGWRAGVPGVRDTLRAWPSTYDLLPMYPAIESDDTPITSTDFFKNQLIGAVDQDALIKAFDRYMRTTEQWTAAAWRLGNTHFVGTGRTTCQFARWDGSRLRTHKSICTWLQERARSKIGDGTVPQISAIPMEHQPGGGWHEVRLKHTKLPGSKATADRIIAELRRLAGKSEYALSDWWIEMGRPTRGDESELQIDIEDAYLFGEDPPTIALEWPDLETPPDQPPYYRITLIGDADRPAANACPPTVEGPFTSREESRWEFRLPRLEPGTYHIETSPSPYGGDPQLSTESFFDVFDETTIEKESDHA